MTDQDFEAGRAAAPPARGAGPHDFWLMLRAAFEVLWLPIALFMSGFFVFYLLIWLWLRVL